MAHDLTFTTSISHHTEDGLELRGHKLSTLVQESNFVATLFLSITGRLPKPAEETLFNAILVSSIDHGIEPASGFVPRVVTASGNTILTAMASTLLALGPHHGGAVTACMEILAEVHNSTDTEKAVRELVVTTRAKKQRVSGFGHAVYKDVDPRTKQLFDLAKKTHLDPSFITIMTMIQDEIEKETGKHLVINIDGALAALLATFGFPPAAGNAVFGLARVAGSIAHILEEQHQGIIVRRLPEGSVEYNEEK